MQKTVLALAGGVNDYLLDPFGRMFQVGESHFFFKEFFVISLLLMF
jgi:hypothetical protein